MNPTYLEVKQQVIDLNIQATTIDLQTINNYEREAFLATVRKLKTIVQEKLPFFQSPAMSEINRDLCHSLNILNDLELQFGTTLFYIKTKYAKNFTTPPLVNATTKVIDIKIFAAQILGIPVGSIKSLIAGGNIYEDETSIKTISAKKLEHIYIIT